MSTLAVSLTSAAVLASLVCSASAQSALNIFGQTTTASSSLDLGGAQRELRLGGVSELVEMPMAVFGSCSQCLPPGEPIVVPPPGEPIVVSRIPPLFPPKSSPWVPRIDFFAPSSPIPCNLRGFDSDYRLVYSNDALAQDCTVPSDHFRRISKVYSAKNVCSWVSSILVKGAECPDGAYPTIREGNIMISVHSEFYKGFLEYEIDIRGPAERLTRFKPVGYERHVVRLLVFVTEKCSELPYMYLRLSLGNVRDFHQMEKEGGNSFAFDPGEAWAPLKSRLHKAIADGVTEEIKKLSYGGQ